MPAYGPEVIGPPPRDTDQQFWDPDIQTMDPQRRRDLQDERVRSMIRAVFERPVPLFLRKLQSAGIESPDDVRSVDDLSAIPTIVKQDLRDSEADAPPWGEYRFTDPRAGVRLGTSTGTTGQPTISVWTRNDLFIEYESAARNWWRMGNRPGMIATHAHPAYLYAGGPMLSSAYEYFGFLNVWVPPPDTDELAESALRFWQRVTPDIPFMGFSTGRFFEVAAKLGIDPKSAGLEFKSMPGFGMGKGLPLMTAGAECYAYLGGACGRLPGAHIHEDWCVVQAIDPDTGREVPDGEWGNLTVTTLGRDNGLLRYDLEEACALLREPCPCGETSIRGLWGGRIKDLLSSQGKRFQVTELEGALRRVPEINEPTLEYVVVKPDGGGAPLVVRVECATAGDAAEVGQRIETLIGEHLGIRAACELIERGALPRSGYKTSRVVDG
ncbi:MAG: Coenzyme synthetase [Acidimicrobiales bacterium]|nr:Coenzyme synthetase [Acidimicrobiales bacterium]